MNAEMLECFRDAPPAAQQVMIEQQREMDKVHAELYEMRERDDRLRQEHLLRGLPAWRRIVLRASWAVYSWSILSYCRN